MRHHPQVKAALDKWWSTAMASIKAEGRSDLWLCRDDYIVISMRMCAHAAPLPPSSGTLDAMFLSHRYKALIAEYSEHEALAEAEADWDKDSQGSGRLGERLTTQNLLSGPDGHGRLCICIALHLLSETCRRPANLLFFCHQNHMSPS